LCGGLFLYSRREAGHQHRQVEWGYGARWGRESGFSTVPALYVRWRRRAASCMRGASSRPRAAAQPLTSPNGTGAPGAPLVGGLTALCMHWRRRAATCMRVAISEGRARPAPTRLPNGTGTIGVLWDRGWGVVLVAVYIPL